MATDKLVYRKLEVTLNNGEKMPIFGLGTWQIPKDVTTEAVKTAIDAGYRLIDCAYSYSNEKEVGDAIKAKISDGTISRKELFVVSKLWSTFHSPGRVDTCLRETLENLQLDYLDMYLMHWPCGFQKSDDYFLRNSEGQILFSDDDYVDVWKQMEEQVAANRIRGIGLANFNKSQINRILANCIIPPAINQVECHAYFNQQRLVDYCRTKTIQIMAYGPLGAPQRPYQSPGDPILLKDPIVEEISKQHNKSTAQILLAHQVQKGIIVIPKSSNKERIKANIQIDDIQFSDEDLRKLNALNKDLRLFLYARVSDHKYFPFHAEF